MIVKEERAGRSGPLTEADLELLGYQSAEQASDDQIKWMGMSPQGRYRVFSAVAPAGIGESRHAFIYLLSNVREQDVKGLEKAISAGDIQQKLGAEETYVVVPNSIMGKPLLKPLGNRPRSYEDLMWKKIQSEVSEYMDGLRNRVDILQKGVFYVEPSFRDSMRARPTEYLYDFLCGEEQEDNGILVVRGDAALGKTTLARKVVHEISQNWNDLRVVPVLLERDTWSALAERSREQRITNLWDVVSLALEHNLQGRAVAGALLNREDLFRNILRQGYAALVFDGFDELPKAGGRATISPVDNFQWLSDVASHSNARIVVTTRPTFWDREMGEDVIRKECILDIVPFSKENAYEYFRLFFEGKASKKAKVQKAKDMYASLDKEIQEQTAHEFINLPVCVDMIADYIDKGGVAPRLEDGQHPVRRFLMAILDREKTRQKIEIDAASLYEAFEEIATVSEGGFTLEDLLCTEALVEEDVPENEILKMRDHAFITSSGEGTHGDFNFKGDFLANHMRASYIHRILMDSKDMPAVIPKCKGNDQKVRECIEQEADGSGLLTDHLASFFGADDLVALGCAHKLCGKAPRLQQLKSFLFHVITKTAPLCHNELSRKELANEVLVHLGGDKETKTVSDLCVQGTVGGISIDEWKIIDSRFSNLNLTKCSGNALHFEQCRFEGELGLTGAQCKFIDCDADEQAKLVISAQGAAEVTEEDIREYLNITLGRFWLRHARTIHEDEWKTGRTKSIEDRFELKKLLLQKGFAELTKYGRMRVQSQAVADLREFMENNRLRGCVREIFDAMKERLVTG